MSVPLGVRRLMGRWKKRGMHLPPSRAERSRMAAQAHAVFARLRGWVGRLGALWMRVCDGAPVAGLWMESARLSGW